MIRRKNWAKKISQHAVFHIWPQVVGKDIAKRSYPYIIRGSVLWVRVSDSVWMQQLHFQKPLILDKINERLRSSVISDLRFQVDSSLDQVEFDENRESQEVEEVFEDPEEAEAFEHMLQSVTDDTEVQEAVKKCWERLRRAKARNSS
ncbi:MAG: DUF721 domain-containing protein [Desulfobulbaceae bacterium]|uniref:DUF721 domain-containing protein n=1 Tax=Candidatus Desulfobia pelagia TaxID=2841692 RepID=A0A8J6NFX1_9BACT|nr:DUF721 domain-containing protein [Candidatus Desulfobia pelagia]